MSGDVLLVLAAAPFAGSFMALLAVRLPARQPVGWVRSACPRCGAVLRPLELIPLLSWLALKGRCSHCGGAISWFYPALEVAALVAALWAWAVVGGGALLWLTAFWGWVLLGLAAADARETILPDALTLPLIPAGLGVTWWLAAAQIGWSFAGIAAGLGLVGGLRALYAWRGQSEPLGLGDAKFLAAIGAWLHLDGLISALLWAALSGLVFALLSGRLKRRADLKRALPFGPFLSLGAWLTWLYGPIAAWP